MEENSKFQNYTVLEPGTKALIPVTVDDCIISKNSKDNTMTVRYRIIVDKGTNLLMDTVVYRSLEELIFDDLSRYSDEELKQELLKREALKSGGLSGYDIT